MDGQSGRPCFQVTHCTIPPCNNYNTVCNISQIENPQGMIPRGFPKEMVEHSCRFVSNKQEGNL